MKLPKSSLFERRNLVKPNKMAAVCKSNKLGSWWRAGRQVREHRTSLLRHGRGCHRIFFLLVVQQTARPLLSTRVLEGSLPCLHSGLVQILFCFSSSFFLPLAKIWWFYKVLIFFLRRGSPKSSGCGGGIYKSWEGFMLARHFSPIPGIFSWYWKGNATAFFSISGKWDWDRGNATQNFFCTRSKLLERGVATQNYFAKS